MTSLLLVALIALPALGFYLGLRWERRRASLELEGIVAQAIREVFGSEQALFKRIAETLEADDDERTQVH